jgi:hypothetical protein
VLLDDSFQRAKLGRVVWWRSAATLVARSLCSSGHFRGATMVTILFWEESIGDLHQIRVSIRD